MFFESVKSEKKIEKLCAILSPQNEHALALPQRSPQLLE